ncbi:MAG TPA: triose-phosphate isomerase [Bryobacteraceae bacterium]|jgi:triosephosphate isomerase|nr:triose-phosphate isomerase [Bryobacteraceae bacterium]
MRRRIMAGNWKMYKTVQQTIEFFQRFNPLVNGVHKCDVVIFPPFVNIPAAQCAAAGTEIKVGGQDVHWGKEGAYTGEISAGMLAAAGCEWVLVGHSERRLYGFETDADVLKKTQSSLEAGLTPVVCVGEKLEERKAGKTEQILVEQFAGGLAGLTEEQFSKVVIAYEPVWAIGTGHTATPDIAADAHRLIRSEVQKRFGSDAAEAVRILYGGSVKPDNVERLMLEQDLDGALVGGASLDAESFSKIVHAA